MQVEGGEGRDRHRATPSVPQFSSKAGEVLVTLAGAVKGMLGATPPQRQVPWAAELW